MSNHTRMFRTILAVALLTAGGFSSVQADDLAMITIESQDQAASAERICGDALRRVGNDFLVYLDGNETGDLTAQHIPFRIVAGDIELSDWFVIYDLDRHPQAGQADLTRFGKTLDLGGGVRLALGDASAAASLSEGGHQVARPLAEMSIPITYTGAPVPGFFLESYPSDSLAEHIEQDSLYAFDTYLEGIGTRYTYSSGNTTARNWIVGKYQQFGYTNVTTPSFYYNGTRRNVKCIKLGTTEPGKIIVIGGHFDSINFDSDPMTFAPGADDNASGTVTALEVARVLANIPLRKTVIFFAFDAEEVGLVGSEAASDAFVVEGADIEVMYNFDMVAFNGDGLGGVNIASGQNTAYRDLTYATMERVSTATPVIINPGSSSDHYPFLQNDFNIVDHIESDFNTLGWHTDIDISSRLDFDYYTQVVRTAVAALAIVADAPSPAVISQIDDVGDGQALVAYWSDCQTDCDYWVRWGATSGNPTDSVLVPAGQCSYTITGLTDGVRCYVSALGIAPNGYPALYGEQSSEIPYLYPRNPRNLEAEAVANQLRLELTWDPNNELDLDYYNVYRKVGQLGAFQLVATNVTTPSYTDENVVPLVNYGYQVTAVDVDGHESEPSGLVDLFPATFSGGMAVVDSYLKEQTSFPTQAHWEAWLDTVFSGAGHGVVVADSAADVVRLTDVGPYSAIYWMDDDFNTKTIAASNIMLEQYADQNTGLCISGWQTIFNWAPKDIPPSHLLYQEFGVSDYDHNSGVFDFVGAAGQNGWPSIEMDRHRGMIGEWRDIAYFTLLPGAVPILTFDSNVDFPTTEGQVVGVAYESAHGKRLLFGFPLYQMTPASATALLSKAVEYFGGVTEYDHGDLDHSGTIDIGDISILIDHLFISNTPLDNPDQADMDGNPGISLGDIYVLVRYLFLGGPAPAPMQ